MKKFKIGIQLFTLREEMKRDFEDTLRTVKEMGYDYVEFAGFYDKSAEEVKAILDKYSLEAFSVHQSYESVLEDTEGSIKFLKTIGAKYLAIPWMAVEKQAGTEDFPKTIEDMTRAGKILKENGIQMLYHNHDFEFKKFEDKFLLDWLYDSIPADLLQTEIDTCWVKYSGNDPVEYMRKYKGRSEVLHLKDFVCKNLAGGRVYELIGDDESANSKEDNGFEFRPVGQGLQDFELILETAEQIGIEYLVVEQDSWPTATAFESARQSREYLKTLGQ